MPPQPATPSNEPAEAMTCQTTTSPVGRHPPVRPPAPRSRKATELRHHEPQAGGHHSMSALRPGAQTEGDLQDRQTGIARSSKASAIAATRDARQLPQAATAGPAPPSVRNVGLITLLTAT
jgi:hypothetical protein